MSRQPRELSIAVPLAHSQVRAANEIHSHLTQWRAADDALADLATRFPGFDGSASLLKVVAINALYGTNVYAIARMAEHIEGVMDRKTTIEGPALVECIAALPALEGQRTRRHHSFASKFAHFFLDSDGYPIFDDYSRSRVAYHLGRRQVTQDERQPYRAFVENFNRLKALAALAVGNRELDRYLWISGQYVAWKKKPRRPMNVELRRLFQNPPKRLRPHFAKMLTGHPEIGGRTTTRG